MNWDLFWVHGLEIERQGIETGFGTFSAVHLLWLAFLAVFNVLYIFAYLKCSERGRGNMRKALALFLIFNEISKQCIMALTGVPVQNYLPLEICSLAEYCILIDAMWPTEHFLKQPLAYIFLPSAFMALAFPTVTVYPPLSYYTIHQFVMHGCIAMYILAGIGTREIRPTYVGIWTSMAKLLVPVALIYPVNVHFDKNFMFLAYHENNVMLKVLWNLSGGKGGIPYIAALIVFILLVLHVVYLIYRLTGRTNDKK